MAENSTASTILSCPSGGFLNVCYGEGESGFIGCCNSNACSSLGCDNGNLRNTSFVASYHYKIPDQSCPDKGTIFYTCEALNPTFWGCCKTDPCKAGGCPDGDLTGAQLKLQSGNPFVPAAALSTTASTLTATSTSTPTSSSSLGGHSSHSVPIGAIIGAAVGGAALLGFIALLLCCFWWRRRKSKKAKNLSSNPPVVTEEVTQNKVMPNSYDQKVAHELESTAVGTDAHYFNDPSKRYSNQSGFSGYNTMGSPPTGYHSHLGPAPQELPGATEYSQPTYELPGSDGHIQHHQPR